MAYEYDRTPITGDLSEYGSVRLHKVDETKWEPFWDEIVREHHYLGYETQIGARVKYVITLGKQIVGAISFCSAAYRLGPRDRYIGWSDEARRSKLPHLVANNRFLILPWVRVRNLASHVLSKSLVHLRGDWGQQYGVSPYMVETFVERERYLGTCYVAANWTYLGITKGYGKQGGTFVYHGKRKDIYVYIIDRTFAREFRPDIKRLQNGREELEAMINGIPTWYPAILPALGITEKITSLIKQYFAAHLGRYIDYLGRKEHRAHFVTMLKGLLSDLERKSIEPIALAFGGKGTVRNTTFFMSKSKWDDEGMHEEYCSEASELLADEGGMLTLDGTDFPKKGRDSVGVARQHCGRLGKTDNCQASVMSGYVSPHGYALIDYELYMPKSWFNADHTALRKKCGVPSSLEFQTKNAIATAMIQKISDSGLFPAKYVGVDSAFGCDSSFLDSLPSDKIYFADVRKNQRVFVRRPEMWVPPYCGKGRRPARQELEFKSQTVEGIAQSDDTPWNDVVLGIGAKGPIITKDKYLQVVEVRDGKPGKDVWLYIRLLEDGSLKYALCNESADATAEDLRRPALMRWSIEQCFRECKEYLGMDHYESRSWDGWRRHMLFCLIAHLFIIKLRIEFSCAARPSGPAPYVDAPVPLDEYLRAAEDMKNGLAIDNPKIAAAPSRPQQVLTIGLVRDMVSASFVKVGKLLESLDYYLHAFAQSYISHSKSSLDQVLTVYHVVDSA